MANFDAKKPTNLLILPLLIKLSNLSRTNSKLPLSLSIVNCFWISSKLKPLLINSTALLTNILNAPQTSFESRTKMLFGVVCIDLATKALL